MGRPLQWDGLRPLRPHADFPAYGRSGASGKITPDRKRKEVRWRQKNYHALHLLFYHSYTTMSTIFCAVSCETIYILWFLEKSRPANTRGQDKKSRNCGQAFLQKTPSAIKRQQRDWFIPQVSALCLRQSSRKCVHLPQSLLLDLHHRPFQV